MVEYLAFEFDLHAPLMQLIRTDDDDIVVDALRIIGLLCSASDSRHVSRLIDLGVIGQIKQRL